MCLIKVMFQSIKNSFFFYFLFFFYLFPIFQVRHCDLAITGYVVSFDNNHFTCRLHITPRWGIGVVWLNPNTYGDIVGFAFNKNRKKVIHISQATEKSPALWSFTVSQATIMRLSVLHGSKYKLSYLKTPQEWFP